MPGTGTLAAFSGHPRLVMWRGGLVQLRAVGPDHPAPDLHSHFAIQLTIKICGDIVFRSSRDGTDQHAAGWLIGSDRPHWISGNGSGATIFLHPLSELGRRAAARIGSTEAVALTGAQWLSGRRELDECWDRGWRSADLQAAVVRIIDLVAPPGTPLPEIDARVQVVIDELSKDSTENTSLRDLAGKVGLSESRLAHLFRQEVGIPMRQYRLSLRMEKAIQWIAQGHSLTEAAHLAGFTDSSQFCRICRRMSGRVPSSFRNSESARRQIFD